MGKFEVVSRFLGRKRAENIFLNHLKANPGWNVDKVNEFYMSQNPSCETVSLQTYTENIFSAYYGERDIKKVVPDDSISSVVAQVPFCKGYTDLIIFNFLNYNYGIRDPILIRLTLMEGTKCFLSKQYLFAPNAVKLIENFGSDVGEGKLPDKGILVVEAFHPRIKIRGGEFRFFVIYKSEKAGMLSGVHSTPAPLHPYKSRENFCYRAFIPAESSKAYYCNFANQKQTLEIHDTSNLFVQAKTVESVVGTQGYCIVTDEYDQPVTIWHDKCGAHVQDLETVKRSEDETSEDKSEPCVTSFYVPDFQIHAPLLRISDEEVGFKLESLTLKVFEENGKFICEKQFDMGSVERNIDTRRAFKNETIEGAVYFVADLGKVIKPSHNRPPCYLHVHYRNQDRLTDQVHTHYSFGYENDRFAKPKSYRCRKFAPIFKNYRNVFSISTAGGFKPNPDNEILLRIFTDKGTEHVLNRHKLQITDGLSTIHGDDLIKQIGSDSIEEVGVLCLEHQTSNYNGSWYVIDRKTGSFATDHFTGA